MFNLILPVLGDQPHVSVYRRYRVSTYQRCHPLGRTRQPLSVNPIEIFWA